MILKILMIVCMILAFMACAEDCKDCSPIPSKIIDGSGNEYTFVTIGTQDWLTENLKTTKFRDGGDIPWVPDSAAWGNLTTPGYTWYKNDQATYGDTYGVLYNWYTVNEGNLCPAGWHVPTDNEWITLTEFLGGEAVAGGKLKETDTVHWQSPNIASDDFGFSARGGGQRFTDDETVAFYGINGHTGWWSSTERSTDWSIVRWSNFSTSYLWRISRLKKQGLYVRCIRD